MGITLVIWNHLRTPKHFGGSYNIWCLVHMHLHSQPWISILLYFIREGHVPYGRTTIKES